MPLKNLPHRRPAGYVVPVGVAATMVEKAEREWGSDAHSVAGAGRTCVSYYPSGHRFVHRSGTRRPCGAFVVRWSHPHAYEATIEAMGWDPNQGGSEEEVRRVIDKLAGYPLARFQATLSA